MQRLVLKEELVREFRHQRLALGVRRSALEDASHDLGQRATLLTLSGTKPLLSSEGWLSTVATINEVTLKMLQRGIGPLIPEEGCAAEHSGQHTLLLDPSAPGSILAFFRKKNSRDNFDCSISNQQQSQYSYGRKNGKQRFKNTVNTHA